jgi:hypothetical protein
MAAADMTMTAEKWVIVAAHADGVLGVFTTRNQSKLGE